MNELPLLLALVTAAALILVLAPLLRAARGAPGRAEFDRAVYRDQLTELERDRARGLLAPEEERAARLEIERRILAADRVEPAKHQEARPLPRLALVLALAVAAGAGGLYLALGSPNVPDLPYLSRSGALDAQAAGAAGLQKTTAELEQKLARDPNDADGWLLLGRSEAELGQWQKGADAYAKALALKPGQPGAAAAYGEMLALAADGIVTPAARQQFQAALAGDPANGVARYYLALGEAQAGRPESAIAAWQKLAGELAADAPLRAEIGRRIAETAAAAKLAPPALAPPAAPAAEAAADAPGPDAAQMAAAADMTPEEREKMIRGMVAGLAQRLQAAPGDLAGWLRLARAYGVLGERDKAADAYEKAAALAPKDAGIPLAEAEALIGDASPETPVPAGAVPLLERAAALSPAEPEALWYLGLAAAQAHDPARAADYWQRLLAALPADAPQRKTVADALAALKGK